MLNGSSQYNKDTITFLINSFRQMVITFGRSVKTVGFFREQVNGLVNINQVKAEEREVVFTLIGMLKTDAVKWEKTIQRLDSYNKVLSTISYETDRNVISHILYAMNDRGEITNEMYSLFCKMYGIQPIKQTKIIDVTVHSEDKSHTDKLWKQIISKYGEYYFRIKNPNAVCSNDIWYYTVQVKDIIKPNVRDYLGMLKQGYAYEICKQEKHDDGCHVNYYYKRDEELNELVHQIDFNNVVIGR